MLPRRGKPLMGPEPNLLVSGAAAGAFEERARTVGARLGGWIVLIGPPPDYMMRANSLRVPGTPLPSALPKGHEQALLPPLDKVFQHSRPAISDLFPGAVADWLVLAALVPVERPSQTRRALALALKPTAMRELLLSQNLPPGTFAAIADSQFRILAHSFDPTGRRVGARAPERQSGWERPLETDRAHWSSGPAGSCPSCVDGPFVARNST